MARTFTFVLLCFALLPGLRAQGTGLLVADSQYLKIPLLPTYSGVKYTEVPVKVSLKKYSRVII